jgi:hypothetical protein
MESASLWNVDVIKAVLEPISASNTFHNHAVRNDAIILSGTVNRPRRRDVDENIRTEAIAASGSCHNRKTLVLTRHIALAYPGFPSICYSTHYYSDRSRPAALMPKESSQKKMRQLVGQS